LPAPDDLQALDCLIGRNIRCQRVMKGLTQVALARAIGVTFQQVQKYEHGVNSVSAARLFQIAGALGIPVTTVFDGIGNASAEGRPTAPRSLADDRQTARLMAAFARIPNGALRARVTDLIEAAAPPRLRPEQ
jgi:transcriptional regulator with XRE-family HTH domain